MYKLWHLLSVAIISYSAQAQMVEITAITGENYRFPLVEVADNPAATEQINSTLRSEILLDLSEFAAEEAPSDLDELLQAIFTPSTEYHMGNTGIDYALTYADDHILSLSVSSEFIGAYPVTNHYYLNFNLEQGQLISVDDFLATDKQQAFSQELDKFVQRRIRQQAKEVESEFGSVHEFVQYVQSSMDADYLRNFQITAKGVEFYINYGLPRVVQALAPDDMYLFLYKDLKPFLALDGILSYKTK